MEILRHIEEHLKNSIPKYVLGFLALLTVDALIMVTPKLLGYVVDLIKAGRITKGELVVYPLILVGLALIIALMRFMWRIFITSESRKLENYMRDKIFAHLTGLDTDFFIRSKTGDLMAHVTNDVNAVRFAFGMGLVISVDSIFVAVTTILLMCFTIDIRLTLLAILPMVIVGIILGITAGGLQRRFRKVQDSFSALTEYVQESYSGIRVIKSYAQGDTFGEGFDKVNSQYKNDNISLIKVWGAVIPLVGLVTSMCMLIALLYGGRLVIDGTISLGDFLACMSYIGLLMWPMLSTGWIINVFHKCRASLNRINRILDAYPTIKDAPNTFEIEDGAEPEVEFVNVSFAYPGTDKKVLEDISFKVKGGESLGIVGRTGSGKTTLGRLLLRQYEKDEGEINIYNYPIESLKIKDIREKTAWVPQDSFLFSESISFNISLGREGISEEKILESASVAALDRDYGQFEFGIDTIVGERGLTLSGGQRQRVGIARALAGDGDILLLDDCLSALDVNTEALILSNLKEYRKSKTTIVIAHRLTAVMDFDQIIVMDRGRIAERGTHEELLMEKGIYNELFYQQMKEGSLRS